MTILPAGAQPTQPTYDAIVVGSGAAGGLAALGLAEAGLNILVLDAGYRRPFFSAPYSWLVARMVSALANPHFLTLIPPRLVYRSRKLLHLLGRARQPIQTQCYAWERLPEAFVDDVDLPYTTPPDRPFTWLRTRVAGGRMIVPGHGRQYFRLGPDDFLPMDGLSPAWPITLDDLAPWYARVEKRLGLYGVRDGVPWLPDSDITHPLSASPAEMQLHRAIRSRWPNAQPILGRYAPPLDALTQAEKTGRMTFRRGAIAREIKTDGNGSVQGVTWVDALTHGETTTQAPIVFLCASALESTRILMLSCDEKNPNGLGGNSGVLGRNLMDHVMIKAEGVGPALEGGLVRLVDGRCTYLPRFDAREQSHVQPGRGYGVQVYQMSGMPGTSYFTAVSFSEMAPRAENHVALDMTRRDRWGIPVLSIDCSYSPAELERMREQAHIVKELAELMGVKVNADSGAVPPPGSAIHESGTARMGDDPSHSVLDPFNQCWAAKGLYVTDSSSFPSQGSQNPTLTVMALTERAVAHAVEKWRRV